MQTSNNIMPRAFRLQSLCDVADAYSTRAIWWHFVGIAIPHNIDHPEHAMLAIEGGMNTNTA